ncbi:MAG: DUF4270 domain-containing protein [Bacteroidia bacterium]|nr:DUF4270 domain-containing protein [Bacteroidia bacterium]
MIRWIRIVPLLWATACRNPQRMGEELFPPPPVQVDTLLITSVRQVFLAPPSTRNAPFVFIGEAEDTLVGRWKGGWATQFSLGGQNVQFFASELVAVDSVVLELFIASSFGDISVPLRLRVTRLIQPLSSAGTYTTESTFLTDGQNLSRPGWDSLYYIAFSPGVRRFHLDTSLGRALLTLPATALVNDAAFHSAFPGLYIEAEPFSPGARSAVYTVFPRSPSTLLRVYYRERIQGQEAPQRYDFAINDTCVWAYRLTRSVQGPPPLRDQLEIDSALWASRLLIGGGVPVGVTFEISGWERIQRRPVLSAQLIWPSDSGSRGAFSAFYTRPNSIVLYADTSDEVASAAWGIGDFRNEEALWDLTAPVQEVALGRRPPPHRFYLWPAGRTYTLQRWVAVGPGAYTRPYLIVNSVEPYR